MTKIERLLLAAMGFNSNLVHFLPPYYVIISKVHICSFTGTIFYGLGPVTKSVLRA